MSLELSHSQQQAVIDYLRPFVTSERQEKIEAVLALRTRYLTVVVEDFHYSQNCSAILRTCEALGIQDVHIVENDSVFQLNQDVTRGCSKWLTLHRYSEEPHNTAACTAQLRQRGYRLVATSPHAGVAPEQLPLDAPLALWMGAEQSGLSAYAQEQADEAVRIPMAVYSESLNVSVSAAICLYALTQRLRCSPAPWSLSEPEKTQLRLLAYRQSARSSAQLERCFLRQRGWLRA